MTHAILTSKGQITIPKSVRNKLNLKTGDKIDFKVSDGGVTLVPVSKSVSEVFGILSRDINKPVSVEEMNLSIKKRIIDRNK
jgi:AbrB family looped-hinge helix DNA binding protein